jgi:hypothetical protein
MSSLPPLTERIDKGAPGGHEFERLMHQLLLRYADRRTAARCSTRPGSARRR